MPTFPEGQTGVTLEAHWKPNLVNYTVEYYTEKLDGSCDMETETRAGQHRQHHEHDGAAQRGVYGQAH